MFSTEMYEEFTNDSEREAARLARLFWERNCVTPDINESQQQISEPASTTISTMELVQTQPSTLDAIIETQILLVPEICKNCGLCKVAVKSTGK